ncbi:MAG TPA: GNAT family N-acetyltransferase [Polyangiaceae bacterium]|nr:GNAT family N-acetyltransferase [Polyangiaceae bacterium]
MKIAPADLESPALRALLAEHLEEMHRVTPAGRVHALPLEALRGADVTIWCAFVGDSLAGCGALKALDPRHGELKAMRTARAHLRAGVASALVRHLLAEAERRGYERVSLETGSSAAFDPARRLYEGFGFAPCGPFGDYRPDPHSSFLARPVGSSRARTSP